MSEPTLTGQTLGTYEIGRLIGKGGLSGNAIRISPPLTVSESEVDEALGIFRESFEAMGA